LEVVTSGQNQRHAYATGLKHHCVTGPRNGNFKVTPELHAEIMRRLQGGESGASIARAVGLSAKTVSLINRGER
jgi:DNA-binding NarL/FixJ family response regulator